MVTLIDLSEFLARCMIAFHEGCTYPPEDQTCTDMNGAIN